MIITPDIILKACNLKEEEKPFIKKVDDFTDFKIQDTLEKLGGRHISHGEIEQVVLECSFRSVGNLNSFEKQATIDPYGRLLECLANQAHNFLYGELLETLSRLSYDAQYEDRRYIVSKLMEIVRTIKGK